MMPRSWTVRTAGLFALLVVGCSPPPGEPEPPAAPAPEWRVAAGQGEAVVDAVVTDGRLLTTEGTVPLAALGTCPESTRVAVDGTAVLWLPPGPEVVLPPRPSVSAAQVERASWRLGEVLGPPEGLSSGREAPDPALHAGARVRAVRKTRRPAGAPVQVILGDRGSEVAVVLVDRGLGEVLDSVVWRTEAAAWDRLGLVSAADLLGTGPVLVVHGVANGRELRAVLPVDLGPEPALGEASIAEGNTPICHPEAVELP